MRVRIVGGGLAGSEAAWQAASRGVPVTLHEMRPVRPTAVHKTDRLAELVCSNSFRGDKLDNAVGLLKEEMRRLGSLVMRAAEASRVPAGAALAVDRERFARDRSRDALADASARSRSSAKRSTAIPASSERDPVIVATGPLTSDALSADIARAGRRRAPLLLRRDQPDRPRRDDRSRRRCSARRAGIGVCRGSSRCGRSARARAAADSAGPPCLRRGRWRGRLPELSDDARRVRALLRRARSHAESATVHDFDKEKFFEGCLPIEVMAHRGVDTLRFGPMKPVGLVDPRTGREPYAVVQLRQDNLAGDHFSLVGFQTQIKWGEQARVLRLIPGLEQAEFVRFGMVHRNTYVNGPTVLAETWQVRARPTLFFAGQMSGVEGYVESAASGLLAGLNAAALAQGRAGRRRRRGRRRSARWPTTCRTPNPAHYEPSNITFGIMPPLERGAARQEAAEARAVGARARRSRRVDARRGLAPTCGRLESPHDRHISKRFLQFLALNRNASAHTVRAYESDLSQFLAHVAATPSVKTRDLRAGAARSRGAPRLSRRAAQRGQSRATAARKLAAVRTFLRYLRREGADRRRSRRAGRRRRSATSACRRTCPRTR